MGTDPNSRHGLKEIGIASGNWGLSPISYISLRNSASAALSAAGRSMPNWWPLFST